MSASSWLFVNDNPDSLAQERPQKLPDKAVKAHVQNVAFSKKKKERIDRLRRPGSFYKPIVSRTTPGRGHEQVLALEPASILTPTSLPRSPDDGDEDVPLSGQDGQTRRSSPLSNVTSAIVRRGSAPPSLLESVFPFGAGRFDPFSTFPFELKHLDDAFLDQFLNIMPLDEFNVDQNSPLVPTRHLIHTTNPAALHAILASGAVHLANLNGGQASPAATYHLSEAMRLLRKGLLESPGLEVMEGLMQAVTELIAIEDMKGKYEEQRIHLIGLKMMIMSQGGLDALVDSPRLQMQIIYVIAASSADYLPTIEGMLNSADFSKSWNDISSHVIQFQTFLRDIGKSTIRRSSADHPRQKFLFKAGSIIHQTLSSSIADLNRKGQGLGFDTSHGYATLIYLSLALLNSQDSPVESERYLRQKQVTIVESNLDLRPNIHLLFFVLLQREGRVCLESASRAWSTVRLMQVLKRLSWITVLRIGQTLLEFLMLVEPGSTDSAPDTAVNVDMIYDEVMPERGRLQSEWFRH